MRFLSGVNKGLTKNWRTSIAKTSKEMRVFQLLFKEKGEF
mgnify:CR=1 FL=1